jgi:hypothetical protein
MKKISLIIFGVSVLIFLGYLFKTNILDTYPKAIEKSRKEYKENKKDFVIEKKISKIQKEKKIFQIKIKNKIKTLLESYLKIPSESKECNNFIDLKKRTTIILQNKNSLIFPTNLLEKSSMKYCSDKVKTHGSVFEIDYIFPGGRGMNGYVNGVIGGIQKNGK